MHLVAVALLVALFALQALKRVVDDPSAVLIAAAVAVGVLAAAAYARFAATRTIFTVLAPAPLLFLALFLFASPVAKMLGSPEQEARAATVGTTTPVVFVVFDELPLLSLLDEDGKIDAAPYPSVAALAADSTWFTRARALSSDTTKAVPSILTGRKPDADRLPFARDHPDNLFTLLDASHELEVVEPLTRLCPDDVCPDETGGFVEQQRRLFSDIGVVYGHLVLPDDLAERLPSISSTWTDFRNNALHDMRDRDDEFRSFVAAIEPRAEPTLWFIHTLLPHHPWRYLPSGAEYARATLIPGWTDDLWGSDEILVAQAYRRHLLQVRFVDRLLRELVARLRTTGLYDRALLVVTADHGVSFRANAPRRRLTRANTAEVGLVPLFVKRPGQERGSVVTGVVDSSDVLPTVADALEIDIPWPTDGHSGFGSEKRVPQLEVKLATALQRQQVLFGSGMYEIGPHADLLGRRAVEITTGTSTIASELLDRELFARVGTASLSPAHVVGILSGAGAEPGLDVAVAVNGIVAATARTFSFAGDVRFEALARVSAFRQGANAVEVYVVSPTGTLLTTRALP